MLLSALLASGANANASIVGGETALMTASRVGDEECVAALLGAGAEVEAREKNDQSAIMWAAAEGALRVVELLLAAGADPFRQLKSSGYSAFFLAIREGKSDLVGFLLENGGDVNSVMDHENGRGDFAKPKTSPLLLAAENGHYDLGVHLLEAGANPNDFRSGFTVLHSLTWIRKPDIGESADGDPAPEGSGRRTSLQFARDLVKHVSVRFRRRHFFLPQIELIFLICSSWLNWVLIRFCPTILGRHRCWWRPGLEVLPPRKKQEMKRSVSRR